MKAIIEQYYDPMTDCQFVRLCLPRLYLVATRRPRLSLFWCLVKLAWEGCYLKARAAENTIAGSRE